MISPVLQRMFSIGEVLLRDGTIIVVFLEPLRQKMLKQNNFFLKCVQRKLGIAGTAIELHHLLF